MKDHSTLPTGRFETHPLTEPLPLWRPASEAEVRTAAMRARRDVENALERLRSGEKLKLSGAAYRCRTR